MKELIIDRFEENLVVCEYGAGKTLDIPRSLLPDDAKEGDVLKIIVDTKKTNNQKEIAESLRKRLFNR